MRRTQARRILDFIAAHPGCTTMDIQRGLDPWVSNPRARISDLRAAGHPIDCRRREDGKDGYYIAPRRPVTAGTQEPLW